MRRLVLAGCFLALALVPSSLGFNQRPVSDSAPRASLRLIDRQPFVVRGQHFKARERVKVVFVSQASRSIKLTASDEGAFTANFGDVEVERCHGFTVQAIGSLGSRAAIKLPAPACKPDQAPARKSD